MKSSGVRILLSLLGLLVFSTPLAAAKKPVLVIPAKLPYHARIPMPNNVVAQCHPETNMSYQLRGQFNKIKNYSEYMLEPPTDGRDYHVLTMEVVDVFGAGGGAFSGSKRLCVRGELSDSQGNSIGSFYIYRSSLGNAMSMGLQGTCQIYLKIYLKMTKDLVKWLRKPTENAYLGEADKAEKIQRAVTTYDRETGK